MKFVMIYETNPEKLSLAHVLSRWAVAAAGAPLLYAIAWEVLGRRLKAEVEALKYA